MADLGLANPMNAPKPLLVLRVNEARDLGEFDRFQFYDHMKTYTAAPPDMLRIVRRSLSLA